MIKIKKQHANKENVNGDEGIKGSSEKPNKLKSKYQNWIFF